MSKNPTFSNAEEDLSAKTASAPPPAGDGEKAIDFGDTPTAEIGRQYADWQTRYREWLGDIDAGTTKEEKPLMVTCAQVQTLVDVVRTQMAAFLPKQPTHVVVHVTETSGAAPIRMWTVKYTGGQVVAPHEYFQLDARTSVSQKQQQFYYEQVAAMDHDWTIGPVVAIGLQRAGFTNVSLVEFVETDLPVLRDMDNPDHLRYLSQHMNFPAHHKPRHTGHALKVGDKVYNLWNGKLLSAPSVRPIDVQLALFLWSRAADLSKRADGSLCPLAAIFMTAVQQTARKVTEKVLEFNK